MTVSPAPRTRLLILGLDPHGRSCVASEIPVVPTAIDGMPGAAIATLFATSQSPPPPCPPGLGTLIEGRPAPGLVQWYVIEHEPRSPAHERATGTELHHRNAIDLVVILDGDGELVLGDGPHPVRSGDCVVMAGLDHALRPGPGGCRLMSFAIGASSPAA
jgi:mannose-6-phosphate isomerase-like protein (cupin superfamily)